MDELFGQLERLRSLERDVALFNERGAAAAAAATASDDEAAGTTTLSQELTLRRLLDNLNTFGYTPPSASTTLVVEGLAELIATVERELPHYVAEARAQLATDSALQYEGLQEYYQIGKLVCTIIRFEVYHLYFFNDCFLKFFFPFFSIS